MEPKRDPQRLSLASYPAGHSVTARFGDMDVNWHLNNVALLSFYEDARVALQMKIFAEHASSRPKGMTMVVAQTTIQYLAPATFPGSYLVGSGVGRLGRTSATQVSGLFRDGVCLGLADTVLVYVVDGEVTVIPPEMRVALAALSFPARLAAPRAPQPRDPSASATAARDLLATAAEPATSAGPGAVEAGTAGEQNT